MVKDRDLRRKGVLCFGGFTGLIFLLRFVGWLKKRRMAIQAQLYSDNIGFPLCGSEDWFDNGCGDGGFNHLCYSLQQKSQLQQLQQPQQLQQQFQSQQQRNQSLYFDNSLLPSSLKNNNSNNRESMMYCQTMVSQVEKQRHEIDQFIRSQVRTKMQSLLGFLFKDRFSNFFNWIPDFFVHFYSE